jgi:hypothetical protein
MLSGCGRELNHHGVIAINRKRLGLARLVPAA